MNRRGALVLALTASGLLGMLALQILALAREGGDVLPARPPFDAADGAPTPEAAADQPAIQEAAILARPLFSRDRKPPRLPADDRAEEAEPLPRLAGIISGAPGGGTAILELRSGTVSVRAGGMAGPYTVVSVAPGRVVLLTPQGERVLRTAFDGARAEGGGAADRAQPGSMPPPVPGPPRPARRTEGSAPGAPPFR